MGDSTTTKPPLSLSLYSLLNLDPEAPNDSLTYNDEQVRRFLLANPLQTKERWECVCGGILHKNVSPLSMACSLHASLPVIMLIASSDPVALEENDNFGLTPLSFSVLFGASAKIVRFLVTKSPSTLTGKDHAGQLPLHIALWKRTPVEIVSLLLDKYPEGARIALKDGRLPLHIACSNQASLEVVQHLLKEYPQACQAAEKEGGWLPIHYACRNDASLQVIQALLHTFPQSATIPQKNGWLALHLACANQAGLDIVSLILLLCPESAMARDRKGYLALHIACKYQASLDVIERLIDIYMDGTKVPGVDGALPLHLACSRQVSLEIIELLVESYPGGLQVRNRDGNTPLQVSQLRDEQKMSAGLSLNHDSMALLSPSSRDRLTALPIPFDRQICSVVLHHSLLSKRPKTAVPLSLVYLRKCTRKFSDSKNKLQSDNASETYRGLDMKTCTGFAVQRFRKQVLLSNHDELVQELEELSHLDHPNLVRLLGYCLQESPRDPTYLVFELAEEGTLASLLSSSDPKKREMFDWKKRIRIAASIASALTYLSSKNRFHESLQPGTICFWEGYDKVLLTDYGNGRIYQSQQFRDASVQSPYAAPEFLGGESEYDERCQVYSLGFILKSLITGHLPDDDEPPGLLARLLVSDADPMAGDWDTRALQTFAAMAESCMGMREDRPMLKELLEDLLILEQASAEKVASAGQVLGALLHVEQVQAEKEEVLMSFDDDLDPDSHSNDGSTSTGNTGNTASLTVYSSCHCSRSNVRGIVCTSDDRHFTCDKCFSEVVNEQLGARTVLCREGCCNAIYSPKQIYEHVQDQLFYNHIREAERSAFLEDVWGRGAMHVLHVQQNQALVALNAMASRDDAPPEFPPLLVLCLDTSRRGGSRIPSPFFGKKRRFLLYFVCAFSKQPVKAAIKISRTRKWLRKVAPALKASMVALDVCVSRIKEKQMTHDMVGDYMSMPVLGNEINQFADESWESIVDTFSLYGHDPSGKAAHERLKEARKLSTEAYEILSELASSYPDWTKEMEFATNKSGVNGWVKSENAAMWKQLE